MTRENLLKTIYDNTDDWSCQYPCPHVMEECNPQNVCMECANRLLTEYEQKIRADAIGECVDILNDSFPFVDNMDIVFGFKCAVERLEQLKEQNNE